MDPKALVQPAPAAPHAYRGDCQCAYCMAEDIEGAEPGAVITVWDRLDTVERVLKRVWNGETDWFLPNGCECGLAGDPPRVVPIYPAPE